MKAACILDGDWGVAPLQVRDAVQEAVTDGAAALEAQCVPLAAAIVSQVAAR